MARTNSQCKKCRRAGEKLFLKGEKCVGPKCPMVKRAFPPGMHGSKGPSKLSNYGKQLKEKQKAKRLYGLREKQFFNYFEKARTKVGNTGELLFRALETRLDNTAYRLGLAASRSQARQLVTHGHFAVGGKKVDIPSFALKIGDVVTVRESKTGKKVFTNLGETLAKKDLAPWLSLDLEKVSGKLTAWPKLGEVEMNIDWRTIVEFYSK